MQNLKTALFSFFLPAFLLAPAANAQETDYGAQVVTTIETWGGYGLAAAVALTLAFWAIKGSKILRRG